MNRMLMIILLALSVTGMSGCSAKNIETQAYAVSLGIDRREEGGISVSVQIPTLSQDGSASGEAGEGGAKGYTFSTADGRTLTGALETLHAGTPRALNLTGVKTIVVSEELASSDLFEGVLEELTMAYRVYGAAELVVCRGMAKDFIREQKAVIGFRLSESTTVALRHYQEIGCIPHARTAEVYDLMRSFYGDSVAIYAAVQEGEEARALPELTGDVYAGMLPGSGDDKIRYFGTALFREGRMVGKLTGMETQLLGMLTGRLKEFSWIVDGVPVRIVVSQTPQVSVEINGDRPVVAVEVRLDMMSAEEGTRVETLHADMVGRLEKMTAHCQVLGTDPFRYAEKAAGRFLTVREWKEFDWPARFQEAQVRYEVWIDRREL